jgi:hypothetical protein
VLPCRSQLDGSPLFVLLSLSASTSAVKPFSETLTMKTKEYIVAGGKLYPAQNLTIYLDNKHHAARVNPVVRNPSKLCTVEFSVYELFYDSIAYYEEQGVCRELPGYSFDSMTGNPFANIPISKPNGTGTVSWYGNKLLNKYSFESSTSNGTYYIDESGAKSRAGRLVFVEIEAGLPGSKPSAHHVAMDFTTFEQEVPSGIFKVPEQCTQPPARCNPEKSAAESVMNMTMYLAHPLNYTGHLANQDAADLRGDAAFLCRYTSPGGSAMDDYDSISKFTMVHLFADHYQRLETVSKFLLSPTQSYASLFL